jgi:hypothetical protein
MSSENQVSEKTPRVADRLAGARRVRFVARQAELDVFRSALAAAKSPFTVLYVHGPGGVGKTTLLREFARLAKETQRTVIALDGRDIPPTRQGLLRALDEALSGVATSEENRRPAVPDRSLVLIDTYEALSALDTWVRDALLPDLPAGVIVALAGRHAPSLPWRTDVAWAPLTRTIELGNFAPGESVAFLESRDVAAAAHANVLDFTHGHPLALSLVADVFAKRPDTKGFDPHLAPDVVRHLLALFLDSIPAPRLRDAMDVCAVARVTSEWLLTELLGADEGRAAFHWLRGQSFVESGPRGVFPHDLVREVLIADARWRDDEGLRKLSRRIYSALYAHIGDASGHERQRLQMDALYVTRTRPTNAAFFDWRALDDVRVEPAGADEAEWIGELTNRHEGSASAALARSWWRSQPGAFHVFRGADDARFGFLSLLDIGQADAATIARDPAIAPALAVVERCGPIARGQSIVYLRWWMHAESYQAVTAAINLTAMHVVSQCVTRPGIAWNFVAMADPSFWAAHFEGVNFARVPEADFEVAGRRYGVFAHDWRIEPPADWMMGVRVPMPFSPAGEGLGASTPVLTEADFRQAVRGALRDYTRPDRLADNPLRFARLLQGVPPGPAIATAIQKLLREAAAALDANPRDTKLYRAVRYTYFEPLESQEKVAERLSLAFSTYRHHLVRGIERIGTWLWHRDRAASR